MNFFEFMCASCENRDIVLYGSSHFRIIPIKGEIVHDAYGKSYRLEFSLVDIITASESSSIDPVGPYFTVCFTNLGKLITPCEIVPLDINRELEALTIKYIENYVY